MKETRQHLDEFERLHKAGGENSWLYPLRRAAIERFAELGFPTLKDEDWRFTNVTPIEKLPFRPVLQVETKGVEQRYVENLTFGGLAPNRAVVVDGHFRPELSSLNQLDDGLIVTDLASALKTQRERIQKCLDRDIRTESNPFTALNKAFFQDGVFIFVPAGQVVEHPIQLLFISSGKESGATAHPRNLIFAEKGSQLTVLETYAGIGHEPGLTNSVTELVLEDGAVVEHCKFQDERLSTYHIAALNAHLGRNTNFIWHSIATGAKLARNNIRTILAGEGVVCVLNGLYLTRDDQVSDHHMVVEHAQPHCQSHEYFNGILDGRSKGVFHGRILVRQPAQKTDAKQTNKNLLLSESATADTKPQLEIYADDVKCTHGATVGQLNEESIFYLRTRGIGAKTARRMLIHAFAGEIIERIRHVPVRDALNKVVWERLEQNPKLAGEGLNSGSEILN